MTNYFLPHFFKLGVRWHFSPLLLLLTSAQAQNRPTWVMPVTSGLAFTHSPWVPSYGATKAALHSFTASLRIQLRSTKVNVIEISPPLVESELHDGNIHYFTFDKVNQVNSRTAQGSTPTVSKFWMPVAEYTSITIAGLQKGDEFVSAGTSLENYDLFEKPKMYALNSRYQGLSLGSRAMPEAVV